MPRAPQPDLKTGIAEGLEGQDLSFLETFELDQEEQEAPDEEQEEESSQAEEEDEVDESPQEDAPEEGESEAEGESDDDRETDEETAVSEEDVPESYMGIDLTGIPAEKRQAIIDGFKEQDRYANRANQRAAELEKQLESQEPAPREPAPEPQAQLSDEEILASLGIDKSDDLFDVKAEFALPLAKQMLEMKNTLSAIQQERALDAFEVQWTKDLSAMEKEHGSLPISYDDLLEYAAENDIDDAETAYLKYMTPRKKQISEEAAKAREEAKRMAKKNASTTRPRTAKVKPKPKDAKDFSEAFRQVEAEQGVNMDSLVKQLAQSL